MNVSSDKFLVHLLSGISSKHLFFLVWLAISGFFALLMVMGYRKSIRRNFRGLDEAAGPRIPVDARRIASSQDSASNRLGKPEGKR